MSKLQAWFKGLPPAVQSVLYAIETGAAAALAIFLGSLYVSLTSAQGLTGFDWHGQVYALEMGVGAAVVKAVIDALKGSAPTQAQKGS